MSYYKVKNISIKNRSVCAACNNIRPLIWSTSRVETKSEEEFIKLVLIDTLDGNFHLQINKSTLNFLWAVWQFRLNDTKCEELHKIRWDNYDYKNKKELYTKEEIKEATEEVKERLYNIYKNITLDTRNFKIRFGSNSFVKKITNAGLHWSTYKDEAKTFFSYQEAFVYVKEKGQYWGDRLSIEQA